MEEALTAGGEVSVRFSYAAGSAPTASDGVWLDNIELECTEPVGQASGYAFLQGTSMAAPQVTGAAALLFSAKPTASVSEVRQALLRGVDPVTSLQGKTVTGGRLDVAKSLAALDEMPPVPVLEATDPPSPANENHPMIVGTAESETQVDIYAGAACEGAPVAGGTAAELAAPGIAVEVADNSSSQFSATATDATEITSPCSAPISYEEVTPDETPPDPPQLTATIPASPGEGATPRIIGSSRGGRHHRPLPRSRLQRCADRDRDGGGTGIDGDLDRDHRREGTEETFSATATDAATNTSTCSAPISYRRLVTVMPPEPPHLTGTSPASPGEAATPRILGSAPASSTVALYLGAGCSGAAIATGTAAGLESAGISVGITVAEGTEALFSAKATDAAENTSACSAPISYRRLVKAIVKPNETIVPPTETSPSSSGPGSAPPAAPAPAPPGCVVPKLIGKPLKTAQVALTKANCALGIVRQPRPRPNLRERFVVASSSPAAGSTRPAGARVALRLVAKQSPRKHHR